VITDFWPPGRTVLGRVFDPRAVQFWDKGHLVSQRMREMTQANPSIDTESWPRMGRVIWDLAAVYGKDARWDAAMPPPAFAAGPVVAVVEELRKSLDDQLKLNN